jgi:hypothetical protein
MAKETTYAGKQGNWQVLLGPLAANSTDLPHLEGPRAKLAAMVAEAAEIHKAQAAHTAAKQDLSKRLQQLVVDGQRLANLLRVALKEHYGIRAEKLAEFGLQPFRGRKVKPAPETPGSEPSNPAADPA